jgi:hypothetical protein
LQVVGVDLKLFMCHAPCPHFCPPYQAGSRFSAL